MVILTSWLRNTSAVLNIECIFQLASDCAANSRGKAGAEINLCTFASHIFFV